MVKREEYLQHLDSLLSIGEKVLATEVTVGKQKSEVHEIQFHDFRISSLSFLSRVYGEKSPHYITFLSEVTQHTASRTKRGIGVLISAKRELENDWLEKTTASLCRDFLIDMLRIATIKKDEGNYYAACAITAAILEKHLRTLSLLNNIEIHNKTQDKAIAKKSLQLISELYKKKLCDRTDKKNIISCIEFLETNSRSSEKEITASKVSQAIKAVHTFINRT